MNFLDEVNSRKNAKRNEAERQRLKEELQERLRSKYHCYMTDPVAYPLTGEERDFVYEVIKAVPEYSWTEDIRKYQLPDKSVHLGMCGLDYLNLNTTRQSKYKIRLDDGLVKYEFTVTSNHNEFEVLFKDTVLTDLKQNLFEGIEESKPAVVKRAEEATMRFIHELPHFESRQCIYIQNSAGSRKEDREWYVLFRDGFFFSSQSFPDREFFVEWISSL